MNILLTSGRAPVTLHLARLFAAAGHRVVVAESHRHHLCRLSNAIAKQYLVSPPNANPSQYIKQLIEIMEQEAINLLIPTCEEIFYIAAHREDFPDPHRVFCESRQRLAPLHHKGEFIRRFASHGFNTPQTWEFTDLPRLHNFLRNFDWPYPLVLKPAFSRFAAKVQVIDKNDPLPNLDIREEYPWILQQFIPGHAFCSYSIAREGRLLAHAVYPVTFRADQGAAIYFEEVSHPLIDSLVEGFLAKETLTGQYAFDFIVDPEGTPFPLECNPRATSGIHLFGPEDGLVDAFLKGTEGIRPGGSKAMLGLAMLLFGPSGSQDLHTPKWLPTWQGAADVIWNRRDPLPFFHQFFILGQIGLKSLIHKKSTTEITTLDIEWNGVD